MKYVIGVDGGSHKCVFKAKDIHGNTLAEKTGTSTNHAIVGVHKAERLIAKLADSLLQSFDGKKEDCLCVVVGASGIDSPGDLLIVENFYVSLGFPCPIFCMNNGRVALYGATGGVGVVAISGVGSIVVGRNKVGKITRSGGYPLSIMGNEGSAQWIAVMAINHMSKWVDGSVPKTRLVENMIDYFDGFDSNKLVECAHSLRRNQVKPEIASLVFAAANDGDEAAAAILRRGARELFCVARDVVGKLGFEKEPVFSCGMWGAVFRETAIYADEYRRLFSKEYPNSELICPDIDRADSAAKIALDYLSGDIPFVHDFVAE